MTAKIVSFVICLISMTLLVSCHSTSADSSGELSGDTSSKSSISDKSPVPSSSKSESFISETSESVASKSTASKPVTHKPQLSALPPEKKEASSKPQISKSSFASDIPISFETSKEEAAPIFSSSYLGEIEQKLLGMVNEERTSRNLTALNWDNLLYKSAKIRSDEMGKTNIFSHTRPDSTAWDTAVKAVKYSYLTARENIIVAQNGVLGYGEDADKVAESLFAAWKNSSAHYEGIIDPDMKETGICVVYTDSDIYATEHFGDPL